MVKLIVAVDKNGAIGKNNDLLYTISEDLKNFKELTTGNTIIMGRKTWESLPIRPLPNRKNIVITRSNMEFDKAYKLSDFEQLKEYIKDNKDEDIYIMGGASIYNQVLEQDLIDEAHITHVDDIVEDADAFVSLEYIKSNFSKSSKIKTFKQDKLSADYIIYKK